MYKNILNHRRLSHFIWETILGNRRMPDWSTEPYHYTNGEQTRHARGPVHFSPHIPLHVLLYFRSYWVKYILWRKKMAFCGNATTLNGLDIRLKPWFPNTAPGITSSLQAFIKWSPKKTNSRFKIWTILQNKGFFVHQWVLPEL